MAAGLTQAELAEKLGYSSQFIANWERNASAPPANRIFEIIQIFGIDELEVIEVLAEDSLTFWKAAIRESAHDQRASVAKKKA